LRPHFASGLLDLVAPRGAVEIAAFVRYARALDDGEAMALAIAECRGWMLATDDRKAVAAATAAKVPVRSTPHLIKRWEDAAAVEDCEINSILSRIKQRARYLPGPHEPLFDWRMGYLSDGPRG
jgi:predicted nucleic acid-binding protein